MTKILIDRQVVEQVLEAYSGGPNWRGFADAMDALKAALAEPGHPAIPLENSREAADAIEATLAEYGHPINPVNAARAGWRAARLYTAPLQPVGPVAWSHINGTSDTKWHPRPAEPVEDTDDKTASIRWQLCLLAQTEEFSEDVRNQIGRGVWLIDRLSAKLQEPVATVVMRHYIDGTSAHSLKWNSRNGENDFPVGTKLYTTPQPAQPVEEPVQEPVVPPSRRWKENRNEH